MQLYLQILRSQNQPNERQTTAARKDFKRIAGKDKITTAEFENYCAEQQEKFNNEIATTRYKFKKEDGKYSLTTEEMLAKGVRFEEGELWQAEETDRAHPEAPLRWLQLHRWYVLGLYAANPEYEEEKDEDLCMHCERHKIWRALLCTECHELYVD